MGVLTDLHMHSHFSYDSNAAPEDMVEAAINKGLKYICFTDHYDKDFFIKDREAVFSPREYLSYMGELRERYKDRISIAVGMELGLQPHLTDTYKYVESLPLDMVIGSVHCIEGTDPSTGRLFANIHPERAYTLMLEETIKNLRVYRDFNVLGHLDYGVRYIPAKGRGYTYGTYREYIDEILRLLVEGGCGIEINTAGLRYGLPFPHPIHGVLGRFKELGGEIVTLGADAHRPEDVAFALRVGAEILKAEGFKYYAVFKDRKPDFIKI